MTAEAALAAFVVARCGAAEVEVHHLGFAPPVGAVRFEGDPCRERPTLRALHEEGSWTIRPQLTLWMEGAVAEADAPAGGQVVAIPGRYRLADRLGAPLPLGTWRAVTPVRAGEPVATGRFEAMPLLASGAQVDLVVHRGALTMTTPVRLLADAPAGSRVPVRVLATDRVVQATVVSTNRVEIP